MSIFPIAQPHCQPTRGQPSLTQDHPRIGRFLEAAVHSKRPMPTHSPPRMPQQHRRACLWDVVCSGCTMGRGCGGGSSNAVARFGWFHSSSDGVVQWYGRLRLSMPPLLFGPLLCFPLRFPVAESVSLCWVDSWGFGSARWPFPSRYALLFAGRPHNTPCAPHTARCAFRSGGCSPWCCGHLSVLRPHVSPLIFACCCTGA